MGSEIQQLTRTGRIAYNGINSSSFLQGYDPVTGIFDKSKLPFMGHPHQLYTMVPFVDVGGEQYRLLILRVCAIYARKYSRGPGRGVPLMFSVNLDRVVDAAMRAQVKKGREKPWRQIIEPGRVQVVDVYRVVANTRNLALLRRVSVDEIE